MSLYLVPFCDVCPISLLLGFIEVGIEINNEFGKEVLSKSTNFKFFLVLATIKFEVFSLTDIPSDLSWHLSTLYYKILIKMHSNNKW